MRALPDTWRGVVVAVRERVHPKLTPGEVQARVPVGVSPQDAPDPAMLGGAYGLIPSRHAMVTVQRFYHDQNANSEGRFVLGVPHDLANPYASRYPIRATIPRSRHAPFGQRANIAVPSHAAFGSMFASSQPTYGLG